MNPRSLEAYQMSVSEFSQRESDIYHRLLANPGETDRQIKDALFGPYTDMNMVRPRVNDLLAKGWIIECGECNDYATGKTVRMLQAVSPQQRMAMESTQQLELFAG